jgi:hypothetical protein
MISEPCSRSPGNELKPELKSHAEKNAIASFTLPDPFTSHPPFSTAFNTHPSILYLHRCDVL